MDKQRIAQTAWSFCRRTKTSGAVIEELLATMSRLVARAEQEKEAEVWNMTSRLDAVPLMDSPAEIAMPPAPCPFCGGQARLYYQLRGRGYLQAAPGTPDMYAYFIVCYSCAAEGGWAKTPGNALRLWNERYDSKTA